MLATAGKTPVRILRRLHWLWQFSASEQPWLVEVADGAEGAAVDGAGAVFAEGFEVIGGWISEVMLEPKFREFDRVFGHDSVPLDFGED